VVDGVASSAGVVTSAALIIVAVFSIFATMSFLDLKVLGVGMAAAVLIDATVVRGIALPARFHGRPRVRSWLAVAPQSWPAAATRASPTGVREYSTDRPERALVTSPAARRTAR